MIPYAVLQETPLDEAAIRSSVESDASGAVVLFAGVVRNHDDAEAIVLGPVLLVVVVAVQRRLTVLRPWRQSD